MALTVETPSFTAPTEQAKADTHGSRSADPRPIAKKAHVNAKPSPRLSKSGAVEPTNASPVVERTQVTIITAPPPNRNRGPTLMFLLASDIVKAQLSSLVMCNATSLAQMDKPLSISAKDATIPMYLRFKIAPAKIAPKTLEVDANCSAALIYDDPAWTTPLIMPTPHQGMPSCAAKKPKARPYSAAPAARGNIANSPLRVMAVAVMRIIFHMTRDLIHSQVYEKRH